MKITLNGTYRIRDGARSVKPVLYGEKVVVRSILAKEKIVWVEHEGHYLELQATELESV